ncbi:hypothetical protein AWW66_09485 [Micromonospora rosaria]|uniref:Uncharacterized protein n=1 Tax=Micromonospora rosaria TaxID=47874 RepID=A0A136PV65_9ACTN|nr:hypothetical protein [Micromonospora rosaria]KXK62253.1 hypothetical protein AWW66_09485 [Micromonospora rosaria]
MTAANLGALLSPLAAAVTVGGITWTTKNRVIREGVIRVGTAVTVLAPCRLRMTVNLLKPSEPGGGDEGAYEPDDIPPVPLQPRVAPGTYRAILEAFAAECFIAIGDDFTWREP